jgi:hypothetical protein
MPQVFFLPYATHQLQQRQQEQGAREEDGGKHAPLVKVILAGKAADVGFGGGHGDVFVFCVSVGRCWLGVIEGAG